jgi:hypothetical protein
MQCILYCCCCYCWLIVERDSIHMLYVLEYQSAASILEYRVFSPPLKSYGIWARMPFVVSHWVSIHMPVSIAHAVSHVWRVQFRCWINSLLHWNHMVFGPELVKRRYLPFHRSLSIETPRWVWSIHMLQHMYGVYSSDAGLILSSIEIIWYLGQN